MSEQLNALRNRIVGHVVDEVYGGAIEDDSVVYETVDVVLRQLLADYTPAADAVLAERKRQIEAEGWTAQHDDAHNDFEMAQAAANYALFCAPTPNNRDTSVMWPWHPKWWKPSTPRRNLVKAGALILAEIERLDRQEARNG